MSLKTCTATYATWMCECVWAERACGRGACPGNYQGELKAERGVPVALQRMFYKVKNLDGVTENWMKEKVTGNGDEGSISHC